MFNIAKQLKWILPCTGLVLLLGCGGGGGGSSGDGSTTTSTSTSGNAGSSTSTDASKSTTVTWQSPSPITYGTALDATQLNATANTTGTFTYAPAAGTVLPAGVQTLSVTFTPTDTSKYSKVTSSVSLTVNKAIPVIRWDTPQPATYGSWLSASALSAVANTDGSFSYSPTSGTAIQTLGIMTLTASFTPKDSSNYAATTATQTLTVTKGVPSLSWTTPTVVQGASLSATQLNAKALYGLAGKFSYSPASGTTLNAAGSSVLTATFTPTDTTHYNSATISTVLSVLPSSNTAYVNWSSAAQTIRGFGGSEAWSWIMPSAKIKALYGTDSASLGLSIMRVRIAPSTWNSTNQTADTSAWSAELTNAKAAQDLGATIFATPWTPPASMKINNSSRSNKLYSGNLNPSSYGDYAKYLNAYINYATSVGVNLYAVSMQNEPDWDPQTYESCLWSADQMDNWAGNYGATAIGTSSVKLMMPESFYFASAMSDPALNDSKAAANISIIGGHLYGSTPTYPTLAKQMGKEIWMTEHFLDSTAKSSTASSWSTNLADALAAAQEIHTSMAIGQYNAYVWWWAVNSNDNQPAGLIDGNNNPNYFGIAMKHFSRYIRPGYVRYDATANPVSGVYLSAYAGGGHYVLVLINANSTAVNLPIQLSNQSVTTLTPYQTTSSSSFAQLSAVSVGSSGFTANLPANSITTYVQ